MAVKLRIGELDTEEQAVLSAAAIGGLGLDLDLVAILMGKSRADVERALPALERRHLVRFDGNRYAFVAPLVAEVVRTECFTPGERRRLERLAVDALADRGDLESQALRCELLARVESSPAALSFIVATLRAAQDAGAVRLARRVRAAGDQMASRGGLDRQELDQVASLA
jgi:DNA-binding GntR family transcriptional regulator